jgi:uncharacterized protein YdeI (YjbR/CyaY-like superfamily)
MEIGVTLYVVHREEWRLWLEEHYNNAHEIWLVYFNKQSGKPRISYDVAVEEALCFGWIDSTIKKLDTHSSAQRFTPRRKNSALSVLNKIRVRNMIELGKMTEAGLQSINHHLEYSTDGNVEVKPFVMPPDIIAKLKRDPLLWRNFESFPDHYKQIRIGFIDGARDRPDEFIKRLNYFIRMTRLNKRYGSMSQPTDERISSMSKR